jgi:hypothetical protein
MKNKLMICLDKIKFKHVLYVDLINKHMELNEEIHYQIQDAKQMKT